MTVTVYTKPDCPACTHTKQLMDHLGIPYTVIDITADPDAMATVQALGYRQAPVVVAGDDHWAGFDFARIRALAKK